jgi:excisionase family DNA binding protein
VPPRFLQLADVAEILSISARQAYALVHTGELPAIQVGGRGQWRVEATELENYIQRKYAETRDMVRSRPHADPHLDSTSIDATAEERVDGI